MEEEEEVSSFPRSLPRRFFIWPRYNFRAAVSFTLHHTNEKHTKKTPPAAQGITEVIRDFKIQRRDGEKNVA